MSKSHGCLPAASDGRWEPALHVDVAGTLRGPDPRQSLAILLSWAIYRIFPDYLNFDERIEFPDADEF